jgi:hypothetical protein
MSPLKVERWVTEDGKICKTEEEARKHEERARGEQRMRDLLEDCWTAQQSFEGVLEHLIYNALEVREALEPFVDPPCVDPIPNAAWALMVVREVARARAAWPSPNHLTIALGEEAGEAQRAILHHNYEDGPLDDVRKALIQVMCVALRLLQEGDPTIGLQPSLVRPKEGGA